MPQVKTWQNLWIQITLLGVSHETIILGLVFSYPEDFQVQSESHVYVRYRTYKGFKLYYNYYDKKPRLHRRLSAIYRW